MKRVLLLAGLVILLGAAYWWFTRTAETKPFEMEKVATFQSGDEQALPTLAFREVAQEAGIDFIHENGESGDKWLPETMGSGVAVLDFDQDGDLDLLFQNARPLAKSERRPGHTIGLALYRNDGSAHFEKVEDFVGNRMDPFGMGIAVGDVDNDGWPDVYLTGVGKATFLRNEKGTYVDRTTPELAGSDNDWSTSAGFLDYDHDGLLDLVVARYVEWNMDLDRDIHYTLNGVDRAFGPPTNYHGTSIRLLHNEGNLQFKDVSIEAGVAEPEPASDRLLGKGLALCFVDPNQDGWLDIVVANDTVRNFFFQNQGNGTFTERGVDAGLAYGPSGSATGAMGMDAAYYRNDSRLAIAIGNFANEMTSLYTSQGPDLFSDSANIEGVGSPSRLALTFGLAFPDLDLDGRPDLVQVNGHLEETIEQIQAEQHYRQPPQLFWNNPSGKPFRFIALPETKMGDLAQPIVGRGLTYGDLDGDGDLDLVITTVAERPRVLLNESPKTNHWLRVHLSGSQSNRDGIGAVLTLTSGETVQRRLISRTASYLCQVPVTATFGLGVKAQSGTLQIQWPSGQAQTIDIPEWDREIRVTEPQ